ncbi:hypothetical protein KKA02_04610 [Patescibacteria group bacterium]|nr:hypothetical protein [Patescibacteria group bacterium]
MSSAQNYINMYKKDNSKAKNLFPQLTRLAEKLTPFLIIATTFLWLWK